MEVLMHDLLIPKFQECPRAWHITAYQSCYLTPCCGLGVQKPTQAIKSVKGTGNTFDLNPNWARICRWEFFMGYLEKPPPPQKNNSNTQTLNTRPDFSFHNKNICCNCKLK